MNIAYTSSNEYAMYAGISLMSVLQSNKDVDDIVIYILDTGISEGNKAKLEAIVKIANRSIIFINAMDKLNQLVEEFSLSPFKNTYRSYIKALLQFFLPQVDKILVLDCDTIVLGNLLELYNMDLEQFYLSAVPEITAYYRSSEDPEIINKNKYYYNTGMMLLNLKRMREGRGAEVILNAKATYGKNLKLAEQSLVNYAFSDNDILPCHFKFNHFLQSYPVKVKKKVIKRYAENGWKYGGGLYKGIVVMHYIGLHPWEKWKFAPYGWLWKRYFNQSQWSDVKLENWLEKEKKYRKKYYPGTIGTWPIVGNIYIATILFCRRYAQSFLQFSKKFFQKH